jgi:two-component system osmolarity sensor histidine kinase EnvZ
MAMTLERTHTAGSASLFARLLRAQLGLVAGLGLVIWALFYVERNVTVATLYAEAWAPQLASAAGLTPAPLASASQVEQRRTAPDESRRVSAVAPRFVALRAALQANGVPVEELRIQLTRPQPKVWVRVTRADGTPLWLGMAGRVVAPEWSRRTLLALTLVGALVLGLSWWTARRLSRPLERLRQRIKHQQPGTPHVAPPTDDVPPEVAAIDVAYAELLSRWQRHERERALLLAGVSHDLRSPLGRIRMAAELLPDVPEVARRQAVITRNVGEADRLIESFLDFVRAGELPCDAVADLAAVAQDVVARFDRPPEQLSLQAPATLMITNANALLVERLIANLIDNALKHGRPPVRVTVSATPPSLTVEDAGDGLAPHQLEALQEAFHRGDSARTQAGSGLGLAIVRQVTARLGARLVFDRDAKGQRVSVVWSSA